MISIMISTICRSFIYFCFLNWGWFSLCSPSRSFNRYTSSRWSCVTTNFNIFGFIFFSTYSGFNLRISANFRSSSWEDRIVRKFYFASNDIFQIWNACLLSCLNATSYSTYSRSDGSKLLKKSSWSSSCSFLNCRFIICNSWLFDIIFTNEKFESWSFPGETYLIWRMQLPASCDKPPKLFNIFPLT